MLERVRALVASSFVEVSEGQSLRVTVSIGAAQLRQGDEPWQLLEQADEALYAAKHQGRNRVVWAGQVKAPSLAPGLLVSPVQQAG